MSVPNFPNGPVGPGFSLNFLRPELRTANSSSMPAHSQSRSNLPNRSSFLSCQPTHSTAQTSAASGQPQKHPTTATIPNLTVITPNGGLVAAAAAAAAATLPQFQHQSVLTSLFQSMLRGQNPITSVNLAMPPTNVTVSYMNSAPTGTTGSTSVSSTTATSERFVDGSRPSPTPTGDPSLYRNLPAHTIASPSTASIKLHNQKLGSVQHPGKLVHQPGMNHTGLPALSTPSTGANLSTAGSTSNTRTTSAGITNAAVNAQGSGLNSVNLLEMLFHSANIITVQPNLGPGKDTPPPIHKLSSMSFLRWASSCTRSFRRSRLSMWPRCNADIDALHGMSWVVAPSGLLGIYSESPFLRPVLLLRRVQFATPGNLVSNLPDPDNMIRTLREMADAKVTKYPPFAPDFPPSASSVGFTTDYLSYVFTLDLHRLLVKMLGDQLKSSNRRPPGPEWRVVLRLGWATSDFYVPSTQLDNCRQYRALVQEALPRCLIVRVGGREVALPDPIFHGGQAQRLGKRLRLSIDITDRLPIRSSGTIQNRFVDIEVNWLHAPLEDQSQALLDLVAGGQITPLLCHLIGLPLIQVTLDRLYSIGELKTALKPHPEEGCVLDRCATECMNNKNLQPLLINSDGSPSDGQKGVLGTYDNCTPAAQLLTIECVKRALKMKFEASMDDDLCVTDGTNDGLDYIPICLLCPLTRTRIELPVRSVRCEHLQCFDFTAYLTINRRRPRWTCPICSVPSPFRDLRLDELSAAILADPKTVGVTFVHVDPNGNWRLAPEEGNDSQVTTSQGHGNTATNSTSHTSNNAPFLSPPRLVAACRSTENSPIRSPTRLVNGDAEAAPEPPALLSPLKSAPLDTAPPTIETCTDPAAEIEVIVLSDDDDDDDDDDDEEEDAGRNMESSSTTASMGMQKESVVGSARIAQTTSENNLLRRPDAPISNPTEMQIDLTNDDDEDFEEDKQKRPPELGSRSLSPTSQIRRSSSIHRGHSRSDPNRNLTSTLSVPELEDERLRNARPLIFISPLTSLATSTSSLLEASASTDARANVVQNETVRTSEVSANDDSCSEATRTASGAVTTKSPNSRHLFQAFGGISPHSQRGPSSGSAANRRERSALHNDRTAPDDYGRSSKRRHYSDKRDNAGSPWMLVRPVSSYLQSSNQTMEDCLPGVDLFDYSDEEPAFSLDGSRHLPVTSSSYISSSSLTDSQKTGSGRHRPPLLKEAQAKALTRLVQQRIAKPHGTTDPVTEPTTAAMAGSSGSLSNCHSRARKSTSRGSVASVPRGRPAPRRGNSTVSRSTTVTTRKQSRRGTGRRGATSTANRLTDDSDSSRGSCFSSEMSCVSASDEASREDQETDSEMNTNGEEDDDSVDSLSSDDRWSPSRHRRSNLVVDVRQDRTRRKLSSRR